MTDSIPSQLIDDIRQIVTASRSAVAQTVNSAMVLTYWQVGRLIVEYEQQGQVRAGYGKKLLEQLSQVLQAEFGRGFDVSNLRNMRRLYLNFPIRETLSLKLSWSHYCKVMRVENTKARDWYIAECVANNWSVRALDRQISTLYYERLLSSADREPVISEAIAKTDELKPDIKDYLRDPYILDFLNLPVTALVESAIEQGLIDNLQHFLLELGRGFAFVARQQRISYDQHYKGNDDNPTIGLILCSEKSAAVAKYSVLADRKQLFASKYLPLLPSEEELRVELLRERALLQFEEGE
jgi:predicted nuclease of restriction endonuclease-like (RecB) superfamily